MLGEFTLGDEDLPDTVDPSNAARDPTGVGSNCGVRASRFGKYRSAGDSGGVADGRSTSLGEGCTLLRLDDNAAVASAGPLEGLV